MGDAALPETLRASLSDGHAAVARCISLTQQLVTFASSRTPSRGTVRVDKVIDELQRLLRRSLPSSIEIDVAVEPDLIVLADSDKLYRVLLNLGINAGDAMPNGGRLRITASHVLEPSDVVPEHLPPGSYVRITVQDSGAGIQPEVMSRIFEPFFTQKSGGAGTGLGLSIAYGIVRAGGGDLLVESEVGVGSVFSVWMPAPSTLDPVADPVVERVDNTIPMAVTGSVLMVDDEAVLRRTLARALGRRGYHVVTASNGEEALQIFRTQLSSIAVVLLDLDMPVLGGEHVLSELKRVSPDLPVIVISGAVNEARQVASLRSGAARFLRKPFTIGALTTAISELTGLCGTTE